jgi:ligand-binding sensor domain-containing protein
VHFDGVEFRTVGLPGNHDFAVKIITTLARRTDGGLWVGLGRGGVGYFDGQRYVSLDAPGLLERISTARVVKEARDGGLFIGVAGMFGKWSGPDSIEVLAPDTDVVSLFEETNGRLWLGTADRGLLYLDEGELKVFSEPGYEAWEDRVISSVEVDRDGLLWVGASNGLHAFNPDFSARPDTGMANQPQAMLLDSHGVLWIGTTSVGLIRYKDGKFSTLSEQDGLASNRILSLAESDDGSIWVGTEDGLSQLADVKFPILSVADGLSEEVCLGVAASPDGGIWAGTANGLSHYRDGTFTNYGYNLANGFFSRWVKRVFAAKNGDVYMISGRVRG